MPIESDLSTAGDRTVAVVLVNYCTRDLTLDCLASLEAEIAASPGAEVIVSDNASPDGSGAEIAAVIAAKGWTWARLLPLPRNGGFSYGNNGAIRELLSRDRPPSYVWLLNTDTVVRSGALRVLVDFMEQNPGVGGAGSRLEHADSSRQCSAFRFHSFISEFETGLGVGFVSRLLKRWKVAPELPDEPTQFDWLSGASMLLRTDLFRDVGLMDEGYFLYYEETDFCRRAQQAGWTFWYVPQSRVVHLVGQSTGVTGADNLRRRRAPYWFESRRRYFVKHHGALYAAVADVALGTGTALSMVLDRLRGRAPSHPAKFLPDLARQSVVFNRSIVVKPS